MLTRDYRYPNGRGVYNKARAKINLTLEVGQAREDGFHQVSMIMQSLRLWDDVELFVGRDTVNTFECNIPFLKMDEKNIAYRAILMMQERFSIDQAVHLRLRKKIPIAAGLAGGSADVAAVLKGMNKLFHLSLSTEKLMELGAEIGSDVPFCIMGGTCLATGRGEKVRQLLPLPRTYIVLVKPDFSVSTPWAYKAFDQWEPGQKPSVEGMIAAIESRDISRMQKEMINMLEPPVIHEHPVIQKLKDRMKEEGADAVSMSGSGPTVYGIFKNEEVAREAHRRMRSEFPYRYQVLFTCTENPRYQMRGEWK
jgi:4-diphosphocytidyl-2-C-methyl-D-erythritol kinase